jgi:hypothetical protein
MLGVLATGVPLTSIRPNIVHVILTYPAEK